jgi:FtsZ-binding cell division protein ZapB
MLEILNVSEIANMIGVEEEIIKRTLERRDADLVPYLHESSDRQSGASEQGEEETWEGNPFSDTPLLSFAGLPLLITKLSFNIPILDTIENLACQVMHLTVVQTENATLTRENQELQHHNEQLQHHINDLQQQLKDSHAKYAELMAAQSRGWIRNLLKSKKANEAPDQD